ncbi:MAG: transposase, partial [Actinobacteria bacterium]|nr:transposase [Actinomycetota bacterium]
MPSGPSRRVCPSIGGPVSLAAHEVRATARVAEREPRMAGHAEFVFCEQSIERTFSWLMRNRRLSKDYERMVQSSESFIEVAMIRLILRRLAKG